MASDDFIDELRVNLWGVAQILRTRGDFTDKVDFFRFICDFFFYKNEWAKIVIKEYLYVYTNDRVMNET